MILFHLRWHAATALMRAGLSLLPPSPYRRELNENLWVLKMRQGSE